MGPISSADLELLDTIRRNKIGDILSPPSDSPPTLGPAPTLDTRPPVALNQAPENPIGDAPIPRARNLTPNSPFAQPQEVNDVQAAYHGRPKEEDFPDPTKMQRFLGLLAGIPLGVVTKNPAIGAAMYTRIAHPDFSHAYSDWRQDLPLKEKSAALAMKEQQRQEAESRLDIQDKRLEEQNKLWKSQIDMNAAHEAQYRARAEAGYESPEERAAREQQNIKTRGETRPWVNARFTSPDGQSHVDLQQNPSDHLWYHLSNLKTPVDIPGDWEMQLVGKTVDPSTANSTPWKAGVQQLLQKYGTVQNIPGWEFDSLRNRIAEMGVTSTQRMNAAANMGRANAMINRGNIYDYAQTGGAPIPQRIPLVGGQKQVAPIGGPPQAPPQQMQAPPPASTTPPVTPGAKPPAPAQKPFVQTETTNKDIIGWADQLYKNPESWHEVSNRSMYPPAQRIAIAKAFKERYGLTVPTPLSPQLKSAEEAANQSVLNVQTIKRILNDNPGLEAFVGPIGGRYAQLAQGIGTDLIPGLPPHLKTAAQELAQAFNSAASSEGLAFGKGRLGKWIIEMAKKTAPDSRMDWDRLKGALRGVEDFADSVRQTANMRRYGQDWRPDATIPPKEGLRYANRETVDLGPDKITGKHQTIWKNLIDEKSGRKAHWDPSIHNYKWE